VGHNRRVGEPTLVVHGHFYQPPRENPWTEEVGAEPTAAPWHDWNERITAECYRPNGWARVLDERGFVTAIVDNYRHLSFDMGPTLLAWLERHHPDVYQRVIDADRAAGCAIALAYNHMILPLANERDVRTQVRWGLADFAHRFGRPAEGMWLPETAVNDAVLGVLVEEGVGFTLLAPSQVARTRAFGDDWRETPSGADVDTTHMYRWFHPELGGRWIDVVVYDDHLSHDVAFTLDRMPSEDLVHGALVSAGGGVVCVASDGETFGHHFRWADRAIAFVFQAAAARAGLRVQPATAVVRERPPVHELRVRESSWSCVHGVGRWHRDCGCRTGGEPGWQQEWRSPLRSALDILRDAGVEIFERRGKRVLRDPWAARDAYVDVVLGRSTRDEFVAAHVVDGLGASEHDVVEAFTLLEAQRNALLMYTSCGWFFNDLAGIETIQVLRYAGRTFDLLDELGESPPHDAFLDRLAEARSNAPGEGDGRDVWRRHVEPARVDERRVVAHLALAALFERRELAATIAGYDIEEHDLRARDRGGIAGVGGLVRLRHCRTGRRSAHVYAAVRLGGLEVYGTTRPADPEADRDAFGALLAAVASGERVTTLLRMIDDSFGPNEFGIEAALPEAAGEIVQSTAGALVERFASEFGQLYEDHRASFATLVAAGLPLPPELRAPAELALARRLESEVAKSVSAADVKSFRNARAIVREARALGIHLATPHAARAMERMLLDAVARAVEDPSVDRVGAALGLLQLVQALDLHIDRDRAQEVVYDALAGGERDERPAGGAEPSLRLLAGALGLAVDGDPPAG
jgi:alpha-amylase/alpha-mannosidase (GH57 family)